MSQLSIPPSMPQGRGSAASALPAPAQNGASGDWLDSFAALLGLGAEQGAESNVADEANRYWFDLYDQLKGLAEGEEWVFSSAHPFIEQLPPEGQFRLFNITNALSSDVREQLLGMMRRADGMHSASVQLGQAQPAIPHYLAANGTAQGESLSFEQAIERVISNAMTPVRQEMTNPVLLQQLTQANGFTTLSLQEATHGVSASEPTLTHSPTRAEWAPVKMAENQQQWGQQLVSVLKDRVQMHLNQDVQHARIRLDPPHLGSLELSVKMENNRIQVHIAAADPALREAAQQGAERLRSELEGKQLAGATVDVDVSDHSQQQPSEQTADMSLAMQPVIEESDWYASQDLLSKADQYRLTRMV
ncbi:flagellar hook-length control protein FliK [Photobacterium sp. DA100]|uniref:flagellar hook-length control protein FliK n=1 Tax=Photobacterium sp. DA100 TaxID=3027472 RepID=UPI00247883CE|nr:flagellar hook-length control protein FliK [Photobacterium sp. DA100]WEM43009.1 flagellar hook-length control protein FliK [Photobacterium sp. DA100]